MRFCRKTSHYKQAEVFSSLATSPAERAFTARLGEAPPFSICQSAFTLVAVMVGVVVLGILLVSLSAGFAFGFAQIHLARENVRAMQILEERMEVVRLLNWDQVITLPGYSYGQFDKCAVGQVSITPGG